MQNNHPALDDNLLELYKKWGVNPPHHSNHGPFDEKNLESFQATRWWVEGNMLYAEGNHGILAQTIPSSHICHGMDENGLPILKPVLPKDHRDGIQEVTQPPVGTHKRGKNKQ